MGDYYSEKLSADRLRRCYELAPPRVRRYLEAEVEFVASRIHPNSSILELGCGYGRVLRRLLPRVGKAVGIDTSIESLRTAQEYPGMCNLAQMDGARLGLAPHTFDVVLCVQNGISALDADPIRLVSESVRVMKPGGKALFSSYSDRFWKDRLEWFVIQSESGLLGEIDYGATGDGVIVCRDGFRATTVRPGDFRQYAERLGLCHEITEVDGSSLFCVYTHPPAR